MKIQTINRDNIKIYNKIFISLYHRHHEFSSDQLDALRQQGIDDNTTIVTFTVKWYYTPEVASITEDLELFFENVSIDKYNFTISQ